MQQEWVVGDFGQLVGAIDTLTKRAPSPLWYRGQRKADWSVRPALWRKDSTGKGYTPEDERNFVHRFRARASARHPSVPDYGDHAGWLRLMQHYGLPTRLLDWSRSPLVAAYFALESYSDNHTSVTVDAALWVLSPHALNFHTAKSTLTPALNSKQCSHLTTPAFYDLDSPRQSGNVLATMASEIDLRMFVQRMRADARQNVDALLEAAKAVFAESGVDAPVRSIAERAGVGVGTLYRHFPLRSDLISAVFRHEIDACVDAAAEIEAEHPPGEALDRWIMRYTEFVATKRGLASALHSGDPAYEPLADYFATHLAPTLDRLLTAAAQSGDIVEVVDASDFLGAVANLCHSGGPIGAAGSGRAERMVRLLLAGLRAGYEDRRVVDPDVSGRAATP